jgi:hypothetical protein
MLASSGESSSMPAHPEQTRCFVNLWVIYDLASGGGDSFDGVVEELRRARDKCPRFIPDKIRASLDYFKHS